MEPAGSYTVTDSPESVSLLLKKKISRGIRYLLVFTAAGLAVLFYATCTRETLAALAHLDIRFLVLAVLLQGADIGLGAWRNHILVRKLKPDISPWLCLKAQLANEFGSAVTPGQSGGGPAWLYVLHLGGISPDRAIAVSVLIFLSTLVSFEISTTISAFAIGGRFSSEPFSISFNSVFLPARVCSCSSS